MLGGITVCLLFLSHNAVLFVTQPFLSFCREPQTPDAPCTRLLWFSVEDSFAFLVFKLYLLLLYREEGGCGSASVQVWSSEVNFVEPVLFFHLYMGSGN